MITSIFVYKKSGLCLFHKNLLEPDEEPHTLTGFFSAINVFSSCLFKEQVQTLATGNLKITFRYFKDNILAVISDRDDDVEKRIYVQKDQLTMWFIDAVNDWFETPYPKLLRNVGGVLWPISLIAAFFFTHPSRSK